MKYLSLLLPFCLTSAFAATGSALPKANATLTSASMKSLQAKTELTPVAQGVKFITTVTGLEPNSVHGYHVHETGKCDGPDYKSAGEHFNPTANHHNGPAAEKKHAGDLGNLVANAKGEAKSEVIIETDIQNPLKSYVGKAVIIHAKADDMQTQPSGNSGDRIACGVIKTQ